MARRKQPKSPVDPTSAERQRRYRAKLAESGYQQINLHVPTKLLKRVDVRARAHETSREQVIVELVTAATSPSRRKVAEPETVNARELAAALGRLAKTLTLAAERLSLAPDPRLLETLDPVNADLQNMGWLLPSLVRDGSAAGGQGSLGLRRRGSMWAKG
jgi:hypothetical protein